MNRDGLKYGFLVVLTNLIAHFQLVFNIFPTKWDNLSAFFPYRYTAIHWWRSGYIPFWDPYQNMGYPMHANPQGSVWYPFTWLFGLFGEYSSYAMNLELVLHITLAGLGMYFLLKSLKIKSSVSYIGAIVFSLSGFVSGTSHMIGFTTGAAWLPWCILFLTQSYKTPSLKNLILLSLVTYFQITGAYTAFNIILVYIYIGYGLYKLFQNRFSKVSFQTLGKILLISGGLSLLLSGPYIYSILDSLSYFSRANPLNYNPIAFDNNFSWQSFQSLFAPYIISAKSGFSRMDVSLCNIHVGLYMLLAFFLFILKLKQNKKTLFLSFVGLSMLLALGNYTPIHKLFFKTLPGINLFRHPYLFSLYAIFGLVICSSLFLSHSRADRSLSRTLKQGIIGLTILIGLILIPLYIQSDLENWQTYFDTVVQLRERSPLNNYSHAFIQLSITLMLFSIGLLLTKWYKLYKVLPLLITLEMVIAVQLSSPLHMYYNIPTEDISTYIQTQGNSTLTNQKWNTPLDSLQKIEPTIGLWVNLNTFKRTTGVDGYNPFIYSTYESLKSSPKFPEIIKNGILYSAQLSTEISLFQLGYNTINFSVKNLNADTIRINQNFHHNWILESHIENSLLCKDKNGLMQVLLPKGEHTITLEYRNKPIKFLHYLSLVTLISLLGILVFRAVGPKQ